MATITTEIFMKNNAPWIRITTTANYTDNLPFVEEKKIYKVNSDAPYYRYSSFVGNVTLNASEIEQLRRFMSSETKETKEPATHDDNSKIIPSPCKIIPFPCVSQPVRTIDDVDGKNIQDGDIEIMVNALAGIECELFYAKASRPELTAAQRMLRAAINELVSASGMATVSK